MQLNYRQQITFVGVLIGAIVGAVGALLWLDHLSGDELETTRAKSVGIGDVARIAASVLAVVRQLNDMTADPDELPEG